MVTTETEIETEIKTETEIMPETKSFKESGIEVLNEVKIAKSKQSYNYSPEKFEEVKREYSTIHQNNTSLSSPEEVEQNKTDNEITYLPKNQNKNIYSLKNARFKNFVICASIVCAISVGLMIYNAVQITITNIQIANIETQITTGVANYESALKQLKKLTSAEELQEQAINLNMGESTETMKVDLIDTRPTIETQTKTNWFNKLCNFLSTLFRG